MKAVLILSGGMDSTVAAYHLLNMGVEVICLSFDYGQKHVKELEAASRTCQELGLPHLVVPLAAQLKTLLGGSSLTDDSIDIPEGHYADDNMKSTVVPNRNMIMLALAAGYAISNGADTIAYGAHAGDHAIYPDCRPEFAAAMERALLLCDYTPLKLIAPFMDMHKGQICAYGDSLGANFANTWTCYKGGEEPCGVCGSCVERAEAFEYANIPDPLVKADGTEESMADAQEDGGEA